MRYTSPSSGLFIPPCSRLKSSNVKWKKTKLLSLPPTTFGTIKIYLKSRERFLATFRIPLPKLLSRKT